MRAFWRVAISAAVAVVYCGVSLMPGTAGTIPNLLYLAVMKVLCPTAPTASPLWRMRIATGIAWGVPVALLTLGTYAILVRYFARQAVAETRCRKCGYILRGITKPRCPECGERI